MIDQTVITNTVFSTFWNVFKMIWWIFPLILAIDFLKGKRGKRLLKKWFDK
jgi:hypothetical protein